MLNLVILNESKVLKKNLYGTCSVPLLKCYYQVVRQTNIIWKVLHALGKKILARHAKLHFWKVPAPLRHTQASCRDFSLLSFLEAHDVVMGPIWQNTECTDAESLKCDSWSRWHCSVRSNWGSIFHLPFPSPFPYMLPPSEFFIEKIAERGNRWQRLKSALC